MDRIFELYDEVVGERVSVHKTLQGALLAMSKAVEKLAPALARDYDDAECVDFSLKYSVKTEKVVE